MSHVVNVLPEAEPRPAAQATHAPPDSFLPAGQLTQFEEPAAEHVLQLASQSVTVHVVAIVPAGLPVPASHMVQLVPDSL